MPDEINFVDLVALSRITPDTVFEKFGGLINSSYFDASNILGTLKQKKLVEFTNAFPGQSAVSVTDLGKAALMEAEGKAKEDFDHLDQEIITQLSKGKRALTDLGGAVNVRPKDLAMHLNKLVQQQYASYQIRNGEVSISLTEKGFLQVKNGFAPKTAQAMGTSENLPSQQQQGAITDVRPESVGTAIGVQKSDAAQQADKPLSSQPRPPASPQQPAQPMQQEQQQVKPQNGEDIAELEKSIMRAKKKSLMTIAVGGGILILIIAALILKYVSTA